MEIFIVIIVLLSILHACKPDTPVISYSIPANFNDNNAQQEAIKVLRELGCNKSTAQKHVQQAFRNGSHTTEELIRNALGDMDI